MRKIAAAVLALPVFLLVYLQLIGRRGMAARLALVVGVGGVLLVAGFGILPRSTNAVPGSTPAAVEARNFGPAVVGAQELDGTMLIEFSAPMDRAAVESALAVEPATPLQLTWLDDDQAVLIAPARHWAPATYYTVSIGTSARDAHGAPLSSALRSAFSTRSATGARITATEVAGTRVRPDTAFVVTFDRDVSMAQAQTAFRIEPAVTGQLLGDDVPSATGVTRDLTFLPDEPLASNTRYVVRMTGTLTDADGSPVAAPRPLAVRTAATPSIVRFRPQAGRDDVARSADVSVRFTRRMDRTSTEAAFRVEVAGGRVRGSLQWFENDTVLLLDPRSDFPYGAEVTVRVAAGARAADGAAIGRARAAAFTVETKPRPAPVVHPSAGHTPRPTPRPTTKPAGGGGGSGGSGAGRSSWYSAERYLLRLMNCTRGGGWVTSDGSCSSPGGGSLSPLQYHAAISTAVSRPYAKKLATAGACTHFLGGTTIGSRLHAQGYHGSHYGENISCRYYSNVMAGAVGLVRFFQSEKTWSPPGGHWVNMMSPNFRYAGIGLWVSHGHMNFVVDFFTP